jgi:hypothetical protein
MGSRSARRQAAASTEHRAPGTEHAAQRAVLLLASDERRWLNAGRYTEELLLLEGVNSLRVVEPARVSDEDLADQARVVVAAEPLRPETARRLLEFVEAGGHLTAFLPDPEFAALFGFTVTFRSLLGGTLHLRRPGFTDEPLQYHGPLRLLTPPSDAEVIGSAFGAALGSRLSALGPTPGGAPDVPPPGVGTLDEAGGPATTGPSTESREPRAGAQRPFPAIVRVTRGAGSATFFLYDLPLSVLLTRQGDPMRAHLHAAGVWHGHRAADLFVGHLDRSRAHLPQADLQCHLLRELLAEPPTAPPLPFLWYFPGLAPTVCLLTSDDDWSTREQFEALRVAAREHGAGITFYLVPGPPDGPAETTVTPEYRAALEAEGHTASLHPVHRPPYDLTWRETVARQAEWFRARFGTAPGPSVRNHCVTWSGYVRGARWLREAGFRYDSNAFSVPPAGEQYQAGAGLPARYTDLDGEVLDIYQVPAQFSDETTLGAGGFPFSLDLSEEEAVHLITARLRENVAGHHSMLGFNAHPVSFATYSGPMWRQVFTEANRLGVPILSLDAFMAFWEARAAVTLSAAEPCPGGWRWLLSTPATLNGLTLLVPVLTEPPDGGPRVHARVDGQPAPARAFAAFGREYLAVPLDVPAGEHTVEVEREGQPL